MTSRGALDWTQALLLTALNDLLCRIAAMPFGIDRLDLPLSLASPKIKLDSRTRRLSVPCTQL